MRIDDLGRLAPDVALDCDLVIVGGGPAGLTLAREFFGAATRVIVVESGGMGEQPGVTELLRVESAGEPRDPAVAAKRRAFHGANSATWDGEAQTFGVRCRGLGGSSQAWYGKSATFDAIDFAARDWVPHSGWPIGRESLAPYFDRAAEALNLGPNCYDESLFQRMGVDPPQPALDRRRLRSYFWQFARSRIDPMDIMRFGPEFVAGEADNVRVLTNATVTHIDATLDGAAFAGLELSTLEGRRRRLTARTCVLAASAIDNARLLLISDRQQPGGLGNRHDQVGRYLMDHAGARIGHFRREDLAKINHRFGFYGLRHKGRAHMYMHGLAMSEEAQRQEGLLNCAVYMLEDRAPDDPWEALKRLLKRGDPSPWADLRVVLSSPGLLAKGMGMKLFASGAFPGFLRHAIINAALAINPNLAAREFQSRGLPHKLTGLFIDAITEQPPDPERRITLSDKVDALGTPLARAHWKIGEAERRSLARIGRLLLEAFPRAGLPAPVLEDWILEDRPGDGVAIDMGHTSGTTRMSADPRNGVVDADCRVHGVEGLYVAGASVFPTCGHANPTLMILTLTIRLADQLKAVIGVGRTPADDAAAARPDVAARRGRSRTPTPVSVAARRPLAPPRAHPSRT